MAPMSYITIAVFICLSLNACSQRIGVPSNLISYEIGPCEEQFDHYDEKIISSNFSYEKNDLIVDIGLNAACCLNIDISEIEKSRDKLKLNILRKGEPCDCYCIYPITLKIKRSPTSTEKLKFIFLDNHEIEIK